MKIGMEDNTMPQPAVSPKPPISNFESYSLPSNSISGSQEIRLDAAHYNPELLDAIRVLRESGMQIVRLADITDAVFIPPRFKRVYVDNPSNGVPFLQGSHIVHFQPADIKHLSSSLHRLEKWIIQAGWILVTCSGTIGRTAICPDEWDGWAASQHILRIVPDEDKCPAGYLCSFLASPLGQVQLNANIYGAVVDELTKEQADSILVPLPETDEDRALVQSLDASRWDSVIKRSRAVSLVNKAIEGVLPSSDVIRESNGFSLPASYLDDDEMRFDAGHFNPSLIRVLDELSNTDTVRLGEIAEVSMPNRFKRVYVEPEYGLPFLQGSHVVHFQAVGLKHLSLEYDGIDNLLVEAGWLLVTRSGTVGRVTVCPEEWHGWPASEHIIRVVPDEKQCPAGYLCSFLASPLGQVQLTSQMHGAVVDQLTEDQVRNVLIPLPDSRTIRKIDSIMKRGMSMKSQAVASVEKSVEELTARFGESGKTNKWGNYKAEYRDETPEQIAKVAPIHRPTKNQ